MLGARSELWRIRWCLRTCVSVAIVCALYLPIPTLEFLDKFSDPAFAAFATVLIKDRTVGATMINFWSCMLASLFATVLAQIVYAILDSLYSDPRGYPVPLVVFLLFITVFILQYSDIHILGKKVGVSLLALNLLNYQKHKRYSKIMIWQFLVSVLIGSVCAVLGNVFPPPARFARLEARDRLKHFGKVLSSLLRQQVTAWLLEPHKGVILERLWDQPHSNSGTFVESGLSGSYLPLTSRWRKLRTLLKAVIAFKCGGKYRIGWLDVPSYHIKNVYVRKELLQFLNGQVEELRRAMAEARYEISFHRDSGRQMSYFKTCAQLVSRLLLLMEEFERQLACIGNQPKHFYIYSNFFSSPDFRRGLDNLVGQIICAASLYFVALEAGKCMVTRKKLEEQLEKMHAARAELDRVYLAMRKRLYYGLSGDPPISEPSRFRPESESTRAQALLPIEAQVTFTLNSSLFLLDSQCDFIAVGFIDLDRAQHTSDSHSLWKRLLKHAWSIRKAFAPCHLRVWRKCTRPTAVSKSRLQAAVLVSSTMLLAGLYGLYARRSQPSLASFTIAYLAGGSTLGVNIMTCINRAIGTVLACVYVIVIAYIVSYAYTSAMSGGISNAAYALKAVVLGVSSVLFQLPCTYIRTHPIYSYAGTVAGFTAALLLINPNLTVSQAVDRIVDTFVGVVVYIIIELLLFAQSSETMILKDISHFLTGINRQFSVFISQVTSLDNEDFGEMSVELDKLQVVLQRQRDLLPFYKSEPSLFGTPPWPDRLLLDILMEEEEVLTSLTLMHEVVCKIKTLANATALPGDEQETKSYQHISDSMHWSSEESDDIAASDIGETDDMVMASSLQHSQSSTLSFGEIVTSRLDISRRDTECTLPHFQPILFPLRPQFKKLECLVEGALMYLNQCLRMLQRGSVQSIWGSYKYELCAGMQDSLCSLCALNHDRFVSASQRLGVKTDERKADFASQQACFCGEMRGETVDKLCQDFQDLVNDLQASVVRNQSPGWYREDSFDMLGETKCEDSRKIVSNQEMMLVSSLLDSTQRIMHAIQHLAQSVGKMQAHRDIVVTQDASEGSSYAWFLDRL